MIRIRRLSLLLFAVASGSFAGAVIACSDSVEDRPTFNEPDTGGSANLPEAAAPFDAGPPADAGNDARGAFDPTDEKVTCTTTPCAVELAAGEFHVCARMNDGTARCWGDSSKGATGTPTDASDGGDAGFVVGAVTGLSGVAQISAGGTTSCARLEDGGVSCWGSNDKGQLGLNPSPALVDEEPHPTPGRAALSGPASRVDVGQTSVCAVLASGELWCWGDNSQRQLARGEKATEGGPAAASLGSLKIKRAVPGTHTILAVTEAGDMVSWGGVAGNEGSVAARIASLSPDPLPLGIGLGSVSNYSVSSTTLVQTGGPRPRPPPQAVAHACAIVKGDAYCWGVSRSGSLATGLPDPARFPTATKVDSAKAWAQQIAAAGDITCVRLTDGTVECAGDDTRGALARGKKGTFSMFFVPATEFTGHAVQVVATKTSMCALVQGGTVECWGSNEQGELGQGTTDTEPHPTPVKVGF